MYVTPQLNIRRVFAPTYWTNPTQIIFNFTDFSDPESGISRYQWGLGNDTNYPPTVINLRNFTGDNTTSDLSVGGQDFTGLTVHQVSYVPPGKTLIDSMDYFVFVQATNMGVPRKTTTIISNMVQVLPTLPQRVCALLIPRYAWTSLQCWWGCSMHGASCCQNESRRA